MYPGSHLPPLTWEGICKSKPFWFILKPTRLSSTVTLLETVYLLHRLRKNENVGVFFSTSANKDIFFCQLAFAFHFLCELYVVTFIIHFSTIIPLVVTTPWKKTLNIFILLSTVIAFSQNFGPNGTKCHRRKTINESTN